MSKNDFEYKYTALTSEERLEIESIKNSYVQKVQATDGLEHLRKLDGIVKNTPTIVSLIVGIIGTLIFGLGLAMILEWQIIVWGMVVLFIGFAVLICAYPIYIKTFKYLKNKYADEIITLSNKLLKND